MSITVVQTAKALLTNSQQSIALTNPVASGNTVIVVLGWLLLRTLDIGAPTDNKGNVYHKVWSGGTSQTAVGSGFQIAYAYNVGGGAGFAVTINSPEFCCCGPSFDFGRAILMEVSGLTTTDPLDASSVHGSTTASTTPSTGSTSPTSQPSEMAVAGVSAGGVVTVAAGSGFGGLVSQTDSFRITVAMAYELLTSVGSVSTTFGLSGAAAYNAGIATFKAAPPAVTGVAPANGPTTGATVVTITGSGFTGATAVHFGANAATNVIVVSDTTMTCLSPAGAAGTVDVTVTTPTGTSATGSADQFTYAAAVVDGRCAAGDTPLTPVLLSSAPLTLATASAAPLTPVALSDAPLN